MYIVFIISLLAFIGIGASSIFVSRSSSEDYLTASRSIAPWLAGLSAVATNNSGYMFIGMIGLTYTTGLSSIWLMAGWLVGDLCANLAFVRKIRESCDAGGIHSFGDVLAQWGEVDYIVLRRLTGLLTVTFLTVYAAAQFKAGSKATQVMFGWSPDLGIWIGAGIVLVYCAAGGLRASIWTDAAQSVVMIMGMSVIMVAGIARLGGIGSAYEHMTQVSGSFMSLSPRPTFSGSMLFFVGWFFGGAAVIGQPHIVVRFMTLRDTRDINAMRWYYYLWFTGFYGATIIVGLLSRVLLSDVSMFDAELALPNITMMVLPELLVGVVLAALFAATMSTADSLIIACTSAVGCDIVPRMKHNLYFIKAITVAVVVVAILIATSDNTTVFRLVLDAWGMLGSAFVPLITIKIFRVPSRQWQAVGMVLAGCLVFVAWSFSPLSATLYAAAPGIVAGLLFYAVTKRFITANA